MISDYIKKYSDGDSEWRIILSPFQSSSEVLFWFVSSVVELDGSKLDEVEFEGPASGIEFVRPTSSSIVVRHTTDSIYVIVTTTLFWSY